MKPEELRQEILRLEERRLRIAPEVMGGEPGALEEDRRLEERIRELAHLAQASSGGGAV
ncbi:MAG: hypothetical protein M3151_10140 [Actinomycetota bacterium]|nr:hypothetical protein [Actinomycetota bacterium]